MEKITTQKEAVKQHLLRHRHLTSLDAIKEYGITRLSHYIYVLRGEGMNIKTIPQEGTNRFGNQTIFAIYKLIS